MRNEVLLEKALFIRRDKREEVRLPHTWNALDGQDGGADYDRNEYQYKIILPVPTPGKRQFIQFDGANHAASVWCNGEYLGKHEGGFSTFRFELTEALRDGENELIVVVDNRSSHIYPQQADFTFFGGLYRPIHYLEVEPVHFDLMKAGTSGVFITPTVQGNVRVDAFLSGVLDGVAVRCRILDAHGEPVLEMSALAEKKTVLHGIVASPILWDGTENPCCYTAELTALQAGQELDQVHQTFGFRDFRVDPETGFALNGRSYPLHGVSRHQDRQDMGWALTEMEHREDLALIQEVGANTIRLAHYQHSQYFYDLCDHAGMVLWAEVPFLSHFINENAACDNIKQQLRELIAQNYNHPSIFFWGISNEITIGGDSPQLVGLLKELNQIAHEMDPHRLTTMAQVTMLEMESEHNQITDVLAYNHYFGWYGGSVEDNGPWLDEFHQMHPGRALGISEYGAEAIPTWHSEKPVAQDYTEEYQALYHEEMLKIFSTRPWLWATYVWNMFDFAADARNEGGLAGRNNKGLVSYDRTLRKDSFYIYKAYWTKEPFVHICGSRFQDRAPGQRNIKVYSNCPRVALYVNGALWREMDGEKVFLFEDVKLADGENTIVVQAEGAAEDMIALNGVETPNPAYVLPQDEENEGVINWFELPEEGRTLSFPKGHFSIKDKVKVIAAHPQAYQVIQEAFQSVNSNGSLGGNSMENMMKLLKDMSLEHVLKMAGKRVPPSLKYVMNAKLIQIKKDQT